MVAWFDIVARVFVTVKEVVELLEMLSVEETENECVGVTVAESLISCVVVTEGETDSEPDEDDSVVMELVTLSEIVRLRVHVSEKDGVDEKERVAVSSLVKEAVSVFDVETLPVDEVVALEESSTDRDWD